MTTINYRGTRETDGGTLFVTVRGDSTLLNPAGTERALPPRFDLHRHSPTGFECGYEGSGPAQLALALLADHLKRHELRAESAALLLEDFEPRSTLTDRVAVAFHQAFKRAVIAKLPRAESWTLSDEQVGRDLDMLIAARVREKNARAAS